MVRQLLFWYNFFKKIQPSRVIQKSSTIWIKICESVWNLLKYTYSSNFKQFHAVQNSELILGNLGKEQATVNTENPDLWLEFHCDKQFKRTLARFTLFFFFETEHWAAFVHLNLNHCFLQWSGENFEFALKSIHVRIIIQKVSEKSISVRRSTSVNAVVFVVVSMSALGLFTSLLRDGT